MIRPRRQPGRTVYRCTLCGAGWRQGGLDEALDHFAASHRAVVASVPGIGLGAPATRQTSGGATDYHVERESM